MSIPKIFYQRKEPRIERMTLKRLLRMFRKNPRSYTWPMMKRVEFSREHRLVQVDQETFGLTLATEFQKRHADVLRRQLQRFSPKDTGRMSRSWKVFPLEARPGKWMLVMKNTKDWFRFAWHYYRGEIKWNRKFIRDFVYQACEDVVRRFFDVTAKPGPPEKVIGEPEVKPKKPTPTPKPVPTPKVEKPKPKPKPIEKPKEIEGLDNALEYLSEPDKSFIKWREELTLNDKIALNYYKGEYHKNANEYLRTGKVLKDPFFDEEKIIELNEILDNAIRKPLPESTVVYRGFSDPIIENIIKKGNANQLKGMPYTDKAYMSTSLTKEATDPFLDDQWIKDKLPIRAKITLPKGKKVASLQNLSGKTDKIKDDGWNELEMLLDRDSKFKITNVTKKKEKIKIPGATREIEFYEVEMESVE